MTGHLESSSTILYHDFSVKYNLYKKKKNLVDVKAKIVPPRGGLVVHFFFLFFLGKRNCSSLELNFDQCGLIYLLISCDLASYIFMVLESMLVIGLNLKKN